MKLTKEKAGFLKVFASLAKGADMLKSSVVIHVKGNKATFTQYGTEYFAIFTEIEIDNPNNEDFKVIWNTSKLYALLEALKYEAEITKSGIATPTGQYTLENFKLVEPEGIEELFVNSDTVIPIKDWHKIFQVKDFLGDQQFGFIAINKNQYIATNRTVGFRGVLDIDPNLTDKMSKYLFIHRDIAKVFPSKDEDDEFQIELYNSMNFWALKNVTKNIKVFINFKVYQILDFDAPEIRKRYDTGEYVILAKDEFYKKLKIMMVFANSNPNRKLFFTFRNGKLVFENRNATPISSDSVDCKYPESFEDRRIVVDGGCILMFEDFLSDTFQIGINFNEAPIKFENYTIDGIKDDRIMIYSRLREE